jgi:hypothetical protein
VTVRVGTQPTYRTADVLAAYGAGIERAVQLDVTRWGRWLPPGLRRIGSGHRRRMTEQQAGAVMVAVEMMGWGLGAKFAGPDGHDAQLNAADVIVAHLLVAVEWPDYVLWLPEPNWVSFIDDPRLVVAKAVGHGGARIVPIRAVVDRLKAVA